MSPAILPPTQPPTDEEHPQSPFEQYFHTNYIPNPPEMASIMDLIDQRQILVDTIDDEIAEVDRRRKELVEKKETHTKYIDTHRRLISPARRLHPDALLAIFLILVSDPDSSAPRFAIHPQGTTIVAVTISHVCRQWREIALASPLLWSYINIALPPLPNRPILAQDSLSWYQTEVSSWDRHIGMMLTRVEVLVERSKGCPLHVSFSASDPRDQYSAMRESEETRQGYLYTVPLLLVRITQVGQNDWASLRIHLKMAQPVSPLVSVVLAFSEISQQGLRCLELDVVYDNSSADRGKIWGAIGGRVDLRKAPITTLTARIPLADMRVFRVQWDSLTSLSTGSSDSTTYFGPQQAANILRTTPNLVQCTIQFLDDTRQPFSGPGQEQAVSLPRLEHLTLRGSTARVEFAALLDTPSLTHLSAINDPRPAQEEDRSAIVELVRRYGAQLTDVTLGYCSLTPSALSFVLERLVEVTSLRLYGKVSTGPVTVSVGWQDGTHSAAVPPIPVETQLDATLIRRLTPGCCDSPESTDASTLDCICPKLQTLICELGDEREPHELRKETKEAFVRFVEARRKATTRCKKGRFGSLDRVDVTFCVGPVDNVLEDLANRGVDTFGIAFKARYAAQHLAPRHYSVPVGGVGRLSISVDHNPQP